MFYSLATDLRYPPLGLDALAKPPVGAEYLLLHNTDFDGNYRLDQNVPDIQIVRVPDNNCFIRSEQQSSSPPWAPYGTHALDFHQNMQVVTLAMVAALQAAGHSGTMHEPWLEEDRMCWRLDDVGAKRLQVVHDTMVSFPKALEAFSVGSMELDRSPYFSMIILPVKNTRFDKKYMRQVFRESKFCEFGSELNWGL